MQIQAGFAFTHLIKCERRPGHYLVHSGMYGLLRHPGYFGWFLWALGTQVMLCNLICTILFYFVVCALRLNRSKAGQCDPAPHSPMLSCSQTQLEN
jgi:protein-S-isoprenylcysteine O-methyltransferase Ste14